MSTHAHHAGELSRKANEMTRTANSPRQHQEAATAHTRAAEAHESLRNLRTAEAHRSLASRHSTQSVMNPTEKLKAKSGPDSLWSAHQIAREKDWKKKL